jgi:hypothetical protein
MRSAAALGVRARAWLWAGGEAFRTSSNCQLAESRHLLLLLSTPSRAQICVATL